MKGGISIVWNDCLICEQLRVQYTCCTLRAEKYGFRDGFYRKYDSLSL